MWVSMFYYLNLDDERNGRMGFIIIIFIIYWIWCMLIVSSRSDESMEDYIKGVNEQNGRDLL